MKNLFIAFLLLSGLVAAQMPNIEKVWLNNSKPYSGIIGNENAPIKLKVNVSEQNKNNDQEYFIAGYSLIENSNYAKFEGKLTITQYRDGKKRSTVYGEYELAEEPKGKHSGLFTGKFIYTFNWNRKKQQIEKQYMEFIGDWKSYDGTMSFKTKWNNQPTK